MLNKCWPHCLSTWNWVRNTIVIRERPRHYANQTAHPLWPLHRGPNFTLSTRRRPCRGLLRDYEPSDGTFWSTNYYNLNSEIKSEIIAINYLHIWYKYLFSGGPRTTCGGGWTGWWMTCTGGRTTAATPAPGTSRGRSVPARYLSHLLWTLDKVR